MWVRSMGLPLKFYQIVNTFIVRQSTSPLDKTQEVLPLRSSYRTTWKDAEAKLRKLSDSIRIYRRLGVPVLGPRRLTG